MHAAKFLVSIALCLTVMLTQVMVERLTDIKRVIDFISAHLPVRPTSGAYRALWVLARRLHRPRHDRRYRCAQGSSR